MRRPDYGSKDENSEKGKSGQGNLTGSQSRSGRRRDHSRRPPTPQDVPFGIRRFMKQM
jgi:hypothetical protein